MSEFPSPDGGTEDFAHFNSAFLSLPTKKRLVYFADFRKMEKKCLLIAVFLLDLLEFSQFCKNGAKLVHGLQRNVTDRRHRERRFAVDKRTARAIVRLGTAARAGSCNIRHLSLQILPDSAIYRESFVCLVFEVLCFFAV